MVEAVAKTYQWQSKDEGGGFWILYDLQNDIQFSIELVENEVWTWMCNALVLDLDGSSRIPNPAQLLRLNDDGLVWCFFAIGRHELGESLYLKYAAMTPLGDLTFASKVIATALRNMQKFTLQIRNTATMNE
jgi:hypothetical protein